MRFARWMFALTALAMIALGPGPASAISLNAARASGLVGETRSGYLAPVQSPSRDVEALINKVNAKRRDHYRSIASRNGVGIDEVARLTAQKLINGLPSGAYYQAPNGNWQRK